MNLIKYWANFSQNIRHLLGITYSRKRGAYSNYLVCVASPFFLLMALTPAAIADGKPEYIDDTTLKEFILNQAQKLVDANETMPNTELQK